MSTFLTIVGKKLPTYAILDKAAFVWHL